MASYKLAKAVFLSIDSASLSGVAISCPEDEGYGKEYDIEQFGLVRDQSLRETFVRDALEAAEDLGMPLIVVGEEWTSHGISNATYASLCESWGKWLAAIENTTQKSQVPVHVVRVNPNTWRAAVFGKGRPKKSADLKKFAVKYCEHALEMPANLDPDIADALCLRVWASRADEVHALLVKKKKKS